MAASPPPPAVALAAAWPPRPCPPPALSGRIECAGWVLTWFAVSIALTLFNKSLFTTFGLRLPLSVTSLHFALKMLLARAAMLAVGVAPLRYTRRTRCLVACNGLATAADVSLSNQAFLFISVTYYTIVKSSVPVWILVFSVAYGLKRPSGSLFLVLALILTGITLATLDPSDPELAALEASSGAPTLLPGLPLGRHRALEEFSELPSDMSESSDVSEGSGDDASAEARWVPSDMSVGLMLVLVSSVAEVLPSGGAAGEGLDEEEAVEDGTMHAACTGAAGEKLCADLGRKGYAAADQDGLHPFAVVYGSAPYGLLLLLPVSMLFERQSLGAYLCCIGLRHGLEVLVTASVSGALAFFMLVAELRVVYLSSGLSLSVVGIFKDLLTVLFSALLLGDQLTPYNVCGLLLCIVGMILYRRFA
ncbi:hypothetical protein AB1Y20_014747 [Prymnesium parvum]|uniref:Sugar phosphate transporter domain-containing protein n=1 Tax=Prymnesium parvum TaxID=97485 RepID=A0AB34IBK5_PRYPA